MNLWDLPAPLSHSSGKGTHEGVQFFDIKLFLHVDPPTQATRAVHQVFENFEVICALTPDPLLEDHVGGVISDVSEQNLIPPLEG